MNENFEQIGLNHEGELETMENVEVIESQQIQHEAVDLSTVIAAKRRWEAGNKERLPGKLYVSGEPGHFQFGYLEAPDPKIVEVLKIQLPEDGLALAALPPEEERNFKIIFLGNID